MDTYRKSLFNLLRMNWLIEPFPDVADWQIEDYRTLTIDQIFKRLEQDELRLDVETFLAYAENSETPEELTNVLTEGVEETATQDRIYLLIFELWRRLLPEKPCLSIFCDELDYYIGLYDAGELESLEPLEDTLINLKAILEENTDLGNPPPEVFQTVSEACANDLEDFLYDFIADQIDQGNDSYATELLDIFYPYIHELRWFDLLRARVVALTDPQKVHQLLHKIVEEAEKDPDLAFNLEVLSFMVQGGEREALIELVEQTLSLIATEEELHDLLTTCADYYQRLDYEWEEGALQKLIANRQKRKKDEPVSREDPVFADLIKILHTRPI